MDMDNLVVEVEEGQLKYFAVWPSSFCYAITVSISYDLPHMLLDVMTSFLIILPSRNDGAPTLLLALHWKTL
jgi:hypothetical protein